MWRGGSRWSGLSVATPFRLAVPEYSRVISPSCFAVEPRLCPREDFVNNSIVEFTGVTWRTPCKETFWLSRTITTSPS
jgi:hypothetical protein